METKRQLDVLNRHLAEHEYMAGGEYTIADIAIWTWYGSVVKGFAYNAGEFLSVHEYAHVIRWVDQIAARPAVKRGRAVNRAFGKPEGQVPERTTPAISTARTWTEPNAELAASARPTGRKRDTHAAQHRPHPDDPRGQPAAAAGVDGASGAAGKGRGGGHRGPCTARWKPPSATSSTSRSRPASTSSMTASSRASAFRPMCPLRMKGFGGESSRKPPTDMMAHPDILAMMARRFPSSGKVSNAPQAIAAVHYDDFSAAKEELDLFDAATEGVAAADRFMTAPSPGIIATTMLNAHYDSHEAYVFALAKEMKKEYALIAARGLVLQIDAPDLAMERTMQFQDKTLAQFLDVARMHVAALNEAIAGIPREQVRLHCCWGNWEGPHVHDVPLADILPVLYGAKVAGLSLEFANPRHQHELAAFKTHPFPDDKILIPGVLDSTTNYVEHPEVVANRICAAAAAIGDRTRIIAGTDCGFGTFAGFEFVSPSIVWAS